MVKFDSSIKKNARYYVSVSSASILEPYSYEAGGEIMIGEKNNSLKQAHGPLGSDPLHKSHKLIEEEAYYPEPNILIVQKQDSFDYTKWNDLNYWVHTLGKRILHQRQEHKLQMHLKTAPDYENYVINVYYTEKPYVKDPTRWIAVDAKGTKSPRLIPAQEDNSDYLKANNEFSLVFPSSGSYVMIAHVAKPDEPLPSGIIDDAVYRQKPDWSFWDTEVQ